MENNDRVAYLRAKDKVKEIRGFYSNVMCYCIVIPTLIFINLKFSPEYLWFWYSACGWGVGVVIHGLSTFGYIPFLTRDWEERKLKELMDKDNTK
jgi:hypothetical protein